MNEQSEEGTAVDYDSQAEVTDFARTMSSGVA